MSAKHRVTTATEATAASVRQIRPLTLPDTSADSAELREHRDRNVPRVSGTLGKIKETWLIPLGAAAVVALLAVTLVVVRHTAGSSPESTTNGTAAGTNAGSDPAALAAIPRYYAIANEGPVSHEGLAAIDVTVGDVHTGKAIATVALPAVGVTVGDNSAVGVSVAADDRTFLIGRKNIYGGVTYFLVRIAPGTKHVATVEQLHIPEVALGVLLGFAISPDGKELAVLSVRGNGTTLRTYSVKSGATLRTWIAGTWHNQSNGAVLQTGVSWTADSRNVAFSRVATTGRTPSYDGALEERLISASAPSGDLAAASTAMLTAPRNCSSLLLTPDGGTVVCATQANYGGPAPATDCGKDGPMFVSYSASTGKRLRVLYQYTGPCDEAVDSVLWTDNSARHVIGEQYLFQRNPPTVTDRWGVAAAGKFTKFPVAQHGQWYSGPGF